MNTNLDEEKCRDACGNNALTNMHHNQGNDILKGATFFFLARQYIIVYLTSLRT